MPRGSRLDTEGAPHHVMVRGLETRAIFLSDKDREDLVDWLSVIAPKTRRALEKGPTLLKDLGWKDDQRRE